MRNFLFRRLTAAPDRGISLFAALTAEARKPHWYVEGGVPDTIDGRFAVLATLAALALVRIEQAGEAGDAASVALTERFVAVMESEHRELGLGDPTLGRTVRKLVGSLARRTELWRSATAEQSSWSAATRESIYTPDAPAGAVAHGARALTDFRAKLERTSLEQLMEGTLR
jgi:cytochrome b pre-mRNA-processing protein 3